MKAQGTCTDQLYKAMYQSHCGPLRATHIRPHPRSESEPQGVQVQFSRFARVILAYSQDSEPQGF